MTTAVEAVFDINGTKASQDHTIDAAFAYTTDFNTTWEIRKWCIHRRLKLRTLTYLDNVSVGVFLTAMENVAALRAQNGATMSRLGFITWNQPLGGSGMWIWARKVPSWQIRQASAAM